MLFDVFVCWFCIIVCVLRVLSVAVRCGYVSVLRYLVCLL